MIVRSKLYLSWNFNVERWAWPNINVLKYWSQVFVHFYCYCLNVGRTGFKINWSQKSIHLVHFPLLHLPCRRIILLFWQLLIFPLSCPPLLSLQIWLSSFVYFTPEIYVFVLPFPCFFFFFFEVVYRYNPSSFIWTWDRQWQLWG